MKPSVGRVVHYQSYGTPGGEYSSVCRAAIVTEVQLAHGVRETEGGIEAVAPVELVGLCVLNPEGLFLNRGVYHAEPTEDGPAPGGTWHWPERVD